MSPTEHNHRPDRPYYIMPSNGAQNIRDTVVLRWGSSDPDGDTVVYDVYFGTTADPAILIADTNATSVLLPVERGTTYYWRIVAQDEHGASSSGSVWSFATPESDAEVILFLPLDAEHLVERGEYERTAYPHDVTFAPNRRGEEGKAARFDGSRSQVTVPHHAIDDFSSKTSFTVNAWVRTESEQEPFAGIIAKQDAGYAAPFYQGYQMSVYDDERVEMAVASRTARKELYTPPINDGNWNMITHVVNAEAGTFELYLNGVRIDSTSWTGGAITSTSWTHIGKDRTSARYFKGLIDDVSVYRRALSAAEVARLFVQ